MVKTTLILKLAGRYGEPTSQTVTYINPSTSNDLLLTFAKKLNSFSTDTIRDVVRVDRQSILKG